MAAPLRAAPVTDPALWAISYEQLMAFAKELKKTWGPEIYEILTMRDVVALAIEPHCAQHGSSYAMSQNPQGLRVSGFVTHCWDERFSKFVSSIQKMIGSMFKKPALFICSFSLFQGDAAQIAAQIDVPIDQSPFIRALEQADYFLVVRNGEVDLYTRGWCIAEVICAIRCGLVPERTLVGGDETFAASTSTCLDFKCYDRRDRLKLMRYILDRSEHDIDRVDSMIADFRSYGQESVRRAAETAPAPVTTTVDKVRKILQKAEESASSDFVRDAVKRCYPTVVERVVQIPAAGHALVPGSAVGVKAKVSGTAPIGNFGIALIAAAPKVAEKETTGA
eukprot:CAMPEP_0115285424 /NCGR_PEP_ID=MMETSP0270-20121206/61415_1 /TAXON_ID=71861 /ORGANISM="Scrippsiella trochoidea, Strain CCMP3099" /LENGTH=335 /DNA_ID=CAMNT_0002702429 /DNA_START=46 /DNA_END=1054 /DNA_ORIENTATION=+